MALKDGRCARGSGAYSSPSRDANGAERRRRRCVLRALAVEHHPILLGGLAPIAVADAAEQRQIALVAVAIDRLALRRGLGRDVEHDRQGGRRQELLHVGQPGRIESERFAVGDARRHVAVADENQPPSSHRLQIVFPLVAIRHVQQLHHVGAVLAFAGQRARDLLADRRAVVGKRHQPGLAPALLQPIAQQLGLRLLPALIEPLERDQRAFHHSVSSASMSSTVWRRRMTRHSPVIDHHFGGQRTAIVIRRHRRAVGAGVANRHEVADRQRRQHAVAADDVAALADRPTISYWRGRARPRLDRLDPVKRVVERRPHQLRHAGVDDRELARRVPRLDVDHARHQRRCRARRSSVLARRRSAARSGALRRPALRHSRAGETTVAAVVGNPQAAADVDVFERLPPFAGVRRSARRRIAPRRGAARGS